MCIHNGGGFDPLRRMWVQCIEGMFAWWCGCLVEIGSIVQHMICL